MSDNVKKEIPKLKVKCNLTCQGLYALPKLIFIMESKCTVQGVSDGYSEF